MSNCTKCTTNEIVRNHMCEQCEAEHNEWLKELTTPEIENDGYVTVYTTV